MERKRSETRDDPGRQKERLNDHFDFVESDEDSDRVGLDHRESGQQNQVGGVLPTLDEERKEKAEGCDERDHQEPGVLVDKCLGKRIVLPNQ